MLAMHRSQTAPVALFDDPVAVVGAIGVRDVLSSGVEAVSGSALTQRKRATSVPEVAPSSPNGYARLCQVTPVPPLAPKTLPSV